MLSSDFAQRTLLCIAHRIRTIVGYDKVVVMDAGHVVEEGSPRELFAREGGLFRALCLKEGISGTDVELAWEDRCMARGRAK